MITATFQHNGKTWTAEGERKEVQNRRCGLAPRYTVTVKSVTSPSGFKSTPVEGTGLWKAAGEALCKAAV